MQKWENVKEALSYAIDEENAAAQFYTEMAEEMAGPGMRQVFLDFAREELGHKAKLKAVMDGAFALDAETKVVDLKIGDYLVDVEPGPQLDYQGALILAMKKEKAAFRLYTDLAAATNDEKVRDIFLALAQEEAKHKLRFELEYDDYVLAEN